MHKDKILKVKCKKCGAKWIPRTAAPKKCPACQSRKWDGSVVYHRVAGPAYKAKKRK